MSLACALVPGRGNTCVSVSVEFLEPAVSPANAPVGCLSSTHLSRFRPAPTTHHASVATEEVERFPNIKAWLL